MPCTKSKSYILCSYNGKNKFATFLSKRMFNPVLSLQYKYLIRFTFHLFFHRRSRHNDLFNLYTSDQKTSLISENPLFKHLVILNKLNDPNMRRFMILLVNTNEASLCTLFPTSIRFYSEHFGSLLVMVWIGPIIEISPYLWLPERKGLAPYSSLLESWIWASLYMYRA